MVPDRSFSGDGFLDVPQAAAALGVSTKTVRNYLKRGYLTCERWNGKIRIPETGIDAVYYKKHGRARSGPRGEEGGSRVGASQVSGKEEAARRSGSARGSAEHDSRIARLEASAASAWTEARKYKEDVERLTGELRESRTQEQSALTKLAILERDQDAYRELARLRMGDLRDRISELERVLRLGQEGLVALRERLKS